MDDSERDRERPSGQGWLPPARSRNVTPVPGPARPPGAQPPVAPPRPAQPVPPHPDGQLQAAPHALRQEPGNGEATAALVLGIVAVVAVVPLGIFFITLPIGLVCGVIAIVLGRSGRRKVDRGETSRNRGQAQAGFVMGVVGTALAVVVIIGFILLTSLSEDFQRNLERGFRQQQEQLQ